MSQRIWNLPLGEGPQDVEQKTRVFCRRHRAVCRKWRPRFLHQIREFSFEEVWRRGNVEGPSQLLWWPTEYQVHILGAVQQLEGHMLAFLSQTKGTVEKVRYELHLHPNPWGEILQT